MIDLTTIQIHLAAFRMEPHDPAAQMQIADDAQAMIHEVEALRREVARLRAAADFMATVGLEQARK